MAKIADREQLEAWLQGSGREVAIVMATRAALRVVPWLADNVRAQPKRTAAIALTSFRAMAAPWLAGTWPSQGAKIARAAATAAARADSAATAYASADSATAFAAARAASAATATAYAAASSATFAAAGAASAATATWAETTADVGAIEGGMSPDWLMRHPLWTGGAPEIIIANWAGLKDALLKRDEDWQVWTEWYDDRLRGAYAAASRVLIEELELKRVLIPNEDWEKGPKHVNALIADLEIEYRAKPPPQRAAIIEVEYHGDGKLHRRPSQPPKARNEAQAERLRAAWDAHSEQVAALEDRNFSNYFPALGRAVQDYRRALGETFDDMNVIALGVHGTRIDAHAARADEGLLEDAAGELVALAAAHGLFIRQFDAWIVYVSDASGPPTAENVKAAIGVVRSLPGAAGIIAEDVAIPAGELADAADPEDRPPQILEREFLRSVGNILSGLFAPLVTYARDARSVAREATLEGIADFTKKATSALLIGGSAYVLALAAGMPGEFGWIIPVMALLKMKLRK